MKAECIVVGSMGVNCYLLTDNGEAMVIDPGYECDRILNCIEKSGCVLKKILLTHGHFDHIGAVSELAGKTGAPVFIHSKDSRMLTDNNSNLSFLTGETVEPYEADGFLDDIEELKIGNSVIKVLHTPGHSSGSVSFLAEDCVFSGDLLFNGSIGRYDFGDLSTELASIKMLMDTLDDSVTVSPGHGPSTTIGYEKLYNPYIA